MRLQNRREYTVKGENTIERFVEEGSWKRKGNVEEISQEEEEERHLSLEKKKKKLEKTKKFGKEKEISQEEEEEERHLSLPGSGRDDKPGTRFRTQLLAQSRTCYHKNISKIQF